jgi:hypothetical protein
VLEGILNHLLCGIVEDEVGFILANAIGQAIMFLRAKENYIRMLKYKTIKISNLSTKLTQNIFANSSRKLHQHPVGPRACSVPLTTHSDMNGGGGPDLPSGG